MVRRVQEPPRPISDKPCFAELVCYYLPSCEWETFKTEQVWDGNITKYHSWFSTHHYKLLAQHPECNKEVLEREWTEHLRLGVMNPCVT